MDKMWKSGDLVRLKSDFKVMVVDRYVPFGYGNCAISVSTPATEEWRNGGESVRCAYFTASPDGVGGYITFVELHEAALEAVS